MLTLVVLAAGCTSSARRASNLGSVRTPAPVGVTASPAASSPPPSPRSPAGPSPSPAASPSPAPVRTSAAPSNPNVISAITPTNRPNPIPGAINGVLTPNLLLTVDANCDAYVPAASSLERLLISAREAGISLGFNRCYRPLAIQNADRAGACTSGNCACAASGGTPTTGGTSMHGWGEAADFKDATGSVDTFTSASYAWLVNQAARFGWNHPGWTLPGNACPEPWHWEWVGDGGRQGGAPIKADVATLVPTGKSQGYRLVTGLGDATAFGQAGTGTTPGSGLGLSRVIVAGAPSPGGDGYWLVSAGGSVYSFGSAGFYGSAPPASPGASPDVAGIAATPSGKGYWLVSTSGQVFNFGDAPALSGPGPANRYVVGAAATPSGKGLWLASSDGRVTALGDARSFPTPAVNPAVDPVVGIASMPGSAGYWLATANGVIEAAGAAPALGSITPAPGEPVVSISPTASGRGCWLVTAEGKVYTFGDAGYFGGS